MPELPEPPAEGAASGARAGSVAPARRDPTNIIRAAVVVVFGSIVAMFVWGFSSGTFTSLEAMQSWVDGFGAAGPVLYIIAQAAQVVVPVIPGGVGIVAGPMLFGFFEGFLYNYIAIVIGSMIDFWVGRHLGLPVVRAFFPAKLIDKYVEWTRRPYFVRGFAAAIFLPVAPDDLLCYLAGMTGMDWKKFTLIIILGKPWSILVYSWIIVFAAESVLNVFVG